MAEKFWSAFGVRRIQFKMYFITLKRKAHSNGDQNIDWLQIWYIPSKTQSYQIHEQIMNRYNELCNATKT